MLPNYTTGMYECAGTDSNCQRPIRPTVLQTAGFTNTQPTHLYGVAEENLTPVNLIHSQVTKTTWYGHSPQRGICTPAKTVRVSCATITPSASKSAPVKN